MKQAGVQRGQAGELAKGTGEKIALGNEVGEDVPDDFQSPFAVIGVR